jgi:hypothetical protein
VVKREMESCRRGRGNIAPSVFYHHQKVSGRTTVIADIIIVKEERSVDSSSLPRQTNTEILRLSYYCYLLEDLQG